MQAVFTSKNKGFLTFAIGNASRVILPREMVYPVLINTTANRVTHSDRRLPNNLVTIALWLRIRTSTWQMISTIISSIYIITDPTGSSSSSSGPNIFFRVLVCSAIFTALQPITSISTTIYASSVSLYKQQDIHIACFAAKTLSCSQKYGENNNLQERSLQYGLHPLLFLIMACFCYLNPLC